MNIIHPITYGIIFYHSVMVLVINVPVQIQVLATLIETIISATHTNHWLLVGLHYTPLETAMNLCASIQMQNSVVIA